MTNPDRECPATFPGETWENAGPASRGMAEELVLEAVRHVEEVCGENGVEEMLIVHEGAIVWQGPHVDRLHRVWSCTKSFLSTCFGLLWDDGLLTPEMPAKDVFPEVSEYYPSMTLEHLATLTGGYDWEETPLDPAPPMFPPGEAFHYSAQSDLLAAILTRLAGRPLEDLFFERIGEPIGITRETMDWKVWTQDRGIDLNGGSGRPGGSVHITGPALARFGWFYANDGVWEETRLISRRYVDYATVPRTSPDTPPHDPDGWYTQLPGNYGLNWWTNGVKPDGNRLWPHAPARTFAAQGNKNNNCFIIPTWRMVVVRLGMDDIIDMGCYDEMFRLLGESLRKSE